jgi:hypothetical protein
MMLVLVFSIPRRAHGQRIASLHMPKWSVSSGPISYKYEEKNFMNLKGTLIGVNGSYFTDIGSNGTRYIGGDLVYASGGTHYTGGLQDSNGNYTPLETSSKDQFFNMRFLFGRYFSQFTRSCPDIHIGLGLWFLHNKADGVGTYDRDITYVYMPMGTSIRAQLSDRINFSAGFDYNLFLGGSAKSALSQADASYSDVTNTQHSGSGYRLQIGVEYAFQQFLLSVEPYYQAWDIARSDYSYSNGSYFVEPANDTRMYGINIGAKF